MELTSPRIENEIAFNTLCSQLNESPFENVRLAVRDTRMTAPNVIRHVGIGALTRSRMTKKPQNRKDFYF
jgi:hypothetical protein